MGLGKAGAIAGRPAHDHRTTRPSSGRIHPLFACDDCSFVEDCGRARSAWRSLFSAPAGRLAAVSLPTNRSGQAREKVHGNRGTNFIGDTSWLHSQALRRRPHVDFPESRPAETIGEGKKGSRIYFSPPKEPNASPRISSHPSRG